MLEYGDVISEQNLTNNIFKYLLNNRTNIIIIGAPIQRDIELIIVG